MPGGTGAMFSARCVCSAACRSIYQYPYALLFQMDLEYPAEQRLVLQDTLKNTFFVRRHSGAIKHHPVFVVAFSVALVQLKLPIQIDWPPKMLTLLCISAGWQVA